MVAAIELRRKKLELEREKHEWKKTRDMANAAKWVFEQLRADDNEYEEDEYPD
jgi:hypothetical protein